MSEAPGSALELVELEFPARPEVVSVARLVIGALAAAEPGFDDERTADLRLAVSEACTNAIQAQRRVEEATGRAEAPITMRCTVGDGEICVEVTDHGGGFDPGALEPHPAVTDPARLDHEGGLGVPLITMLSDDLEFVGLARGTQLVMRFGPRTPGLAPPLPEP
ncbi:MAG: ATP-binding protein [Acidimicrobiales bacterium]|nr:ATP-binding protein [Acidimicrobiales bacterium]